MYFKFGISAKLKQPTGLTGTNIGTEEEQKYEVVNSVSKQKAQNYIH